MFSSSHTQNFKRKKEVVMMRPRERLAARARASCAPWATVDQSTIAAGCSSRQPCACCAPPLAGFGQRCSRDLYSKLAREPVLSPAHTCHALPRFERTVLRTKITSCRANSSKNRLLERCCVLAKLAMPFKTKPTITQNDVALRAMCGVYASLESKLGLLNSERTVPWAQKIH